MNNQEKKYEVVKYNNDDSDISIDVFVSLLENTVWLSQKQMSILFKTSTDNISLHIKKIINDLDLIAPVAKNYSVTASDGKTYKTKIYNLEIINEVGLKTKSTKLNHFKKWVGETLNYLKYKNGVDRQLITFNYGEISLDVTVTPEQDTVWLSQNDMAFLFETSKQNISLHIKNIFNEEELDNSVVKDFFTTASDGKIYQIKLYNLDMIIAVGYRINSKRGTMFRRWATSVLKQYLLNGHVINEDRCLACTSNIISLNNKISSLESQFNDMKETIYKSNEKMIFEGEIVEPYSFLRHLFFLAKKEITIIDCYADKFLLNMISDLNIKITIITSSSSYLNKEIIPDNITVIYNDFFHDRFIFIDDYVYTLGNSFNAIGKKRFVIIKLENITKEMILK